MIKTLLKLEGSGFIYLIAILVEILMAQLLLKI